MEIVIYKITNLINNKVYVGQTVNFKERVRSHKETPFRQTSYGYEYPLYRAMRKYGLENFEFAIIDKADTFEKADELEIYYIQFYDSCVDNGKGYNQELGGHNGAKSEETKQKISKAHKGYGGGSFGKKRGESYRARKVMCLENGIIYPSLLDCAEDLFSKDFSKTDRIKIGACANPRSNRFTHKGYSFRYVDNNGNIIPKETQKGSYSKYNHGMKIIETKSNRIFDSITEASKYFNISVNMIRDRIYKRVCDTRFNFMNYEDFIANGEALTDNADGNPVPSLVNEEGVETTEKISETIISENN